MHLTRFDGEDPNLLVIWNEIAAGGINHNLYISYVTGVMPAPGSWINTLEIQKYLVRTSTHAIFNPIAITISTNELLVGWSEKHVSSGTKAEIWLTGIKIGNLPLPADPFRFRGGVDSLGESWLTAQIINSAVNRPWNIFGFDMAIAKKRHFVIAYPTKFNSVVPVASQFNNYQDVVNIVMEHYEIGIHSLTHLGTMLHLNPSEYNYWEYRPKITRMDESQFLVGWLAERSMGSIQNRHWAWVQIDSADELSIISAKQEDTIATYNSRQVWSKPVKINNNQYSFFSRKRLSDTDFGLLVNYLQYTFKPANCHLENAKLIPRGDTWGIIVFTGQLYPGGHNMLSVIPYTSYTFGIISSGSDYGKFELTGSGIKSLYFTGDNSGRETAYSISVNCDLLGTVPALTSSNSISVAYQTLTTSSGGSSSESTAVWVWVIIGIGIGLILINVVWIIVF